MTTDYITARAPLVERAYELARSGSCRDAPEVHERLVSEGYHLSVYFKRESLSKDLLRVCREARDERPPRVPIGELLRGWFTTAFLTDLALGEDPRQRLANQG